MRSPVRLALCSLAVGLAPAHGIAAQPAPVIGGLVRATPQDCALVGAAMRAALRPNLNLDIRAADGPHGVLEGSPQTLADILRERLPSLSGDLSLEFAQDIYAATPDFYEMRCDWAAYGQPARVPLKVCFQGTDRCETQPDTARSEIIVRRPWVSRDGRDALVRMALTVSVDTGDSYYCHLRRDGDGWAVVNCQNEPY